jgi:HlyD family secretion protein
MVRTETSEDPEQMFVPNFRPGMSATVDVETQTAVNVVSVPIQAVTVRDFAEDRSSENAQSDSAEIVLASSQDEGLMIQEEDIRKVVFVIEDGKAVRREVETGISDNSHIQILSGLEAGEEVVIGSYRTLSNSLNNGDKVKVNNKIAALN